LAVVLGVIAAITSTRQAYAQSQSQSQATERRVLYALEYPEDVAGGCGDEDKLSRLIEERLVRPVFVEDRDEADIVLSIQKGSGAAELVIVSADHAGAELGRRTVVVLHSDCPKVLDTLAVVLAIIIGPERTTTDPPRTPKARDESPPPAPIKEDVPPIKRVGPDVAAQPEEKLRWTVSPIAGASLGTGVLPGVAWAVEVGAIVRLPVRGVSLIARGYYWPPVSTRTPPPADVDRIGGSLFGCLDLFRTGGSRDGLRTAGCSGLDVSRLVAASNDLTRASDSSVVLALGLEMRLGYRFSLGNLSIEPFVAPQISAILRRDRFTYRDPTAGSGDRQLTLLQPAVVAFQSTLGIAVHFL